MHFKLLLLLQRAPNQWGYLFIIHSVLQMLLNNLIIVEIINPQKLENGIVIFEKLTVFTKSARIGQKLKEQQAHGDKNN